MLSNVALSECDDVIKFGGTPFCIDAARRAGASDELAYAEIAAAAMQTINHSTLAGEA